MRVCGGGHRLRPFHAVVGWTAQTLWTAWTPRSLWTARTHRAGDHHLVVEQVAEQFIQLGPLLQRRHCRLVARDGVVGEAVIQGRPTCTRQGAAAAVVCAGAVHLGAVGGRHQFGVVLLLQL